MLVHYFADVNETLHSSLLFVILGFRKIATSNLPMITSFAYKCVTYANVNTIVVMPLSFVFKSCWIRHESNMEVSIVNCKHLVLRDYESVFKEGVSLGNIVGKISSYLFGKLLLLMSSLLSKKRAKHNTVWHQCHWRDCRNKIKGNTRLL